MAIRDATCTPASKADDLVPTDVGKLVRVQVDVWYPRSGCLSLNFAVCYMATPSPVIQEWRQISPERKIKGRHVPQNSPPTCPVSIDHRIVFFFQGVYNLSAPSPWKNGSSTIVPSKMTPGRGGSMTSWATRAKAGPTSVSLRPMTTCRLARDRVAWRKRQKRHYNLPTSIPFFLFSSSLNMVENHLFHFFFHF